MQLYVFDISRRTLSQTLEDFETCGETPLFIKPFYNFDRETNQYVESSKKLVYCSYKVKQQMQLAFSSYNRVREFNWDTFRLPEHNETWALHISNVPAEYEKIHQIIAPLCDKEKYVLTSGNNYATLVIKEDDQYTIKLCKLLLHHNWIGQNIISCNWKRKQSVSRNC